jgi:hypothetical protein
VRTRNLAVVFLRLSPLAERTRPAPLERMAPTGKPRPVSDRSQSGRPTKRCRGGYRLCQHVRRDEQQVEEASRNERESRDDSTRSPTTPQEPREQRHPRQGDREPTNRTISKNVVLTAWPK